MMMKLRITIEISENNFEIAENLFFKFFINSCENNRNLPENVNNLKKNIIINNNINQNEKIQKHQNYLKKFFNLFFDDNKNEIKK
jgi:hypothetical protein